jgi:phosphoribosyl-ATP pyrophosphohydrolase
MRELHIRTRREVVRGTAMDDFTIYDLERRVDARAASDPDVSYTRKLLDRGVAQCAKKLGEEAVELALAAVIESRERLIEETADLLYHLLVVLKARDIKLSEVETVLGARARQTGLQEKASRKSG